LKKLGESAGIEDLMTVYGEYQGLMRIATQYLKEISPKFISLTTDDTSDKDLLNFKNRLEEERGIIWMETV